MKLLKIIGFNGNGCTNWQKGILIQNSFVIGDRFGNFYQDSNLILVLRMGEWL